MGEKQGGVVARMKYRLGKKAKRRWRGNIDDKER
jgi:hypothetical protein